MSVDDRLHAAFRTTDESWEPSTEVALRDVVRHRRDLGNDRLGDEPARGEGRDRVRGERLRNANGAARAGRSRASRRADARTRDSRALGERGAIDWRHLESDADRRNTSSDILDDATKTDKDGHERSTPHQLSSVTVRLCPLLSSVTLC